MDVHGVPWAHAVNPRTANRLSAGSNTVTWEPTLTEELTRSWSESADWGEDDDGEGSGAGGRRREGAADGHAIPTRTSFEDASPLHTRTAGAGSRGGRGATLGHPPAHAAPGVAQRGGPGSNSWSGPAPEGVPAQPLSSLTPPPSPGPLVPAPPSQAGAPSGGPRPRALGRRPTEGPRPGDAGEGHAGQQPGQHEPPEGHACDERGLEGDVEVQGHACGPAADGSASALPGCLGSVDWAAELLAARRAWQPPAHAGGQASTPLRATRAPKGSLACTSASSAVSLSAERSSPSGSWLGTAMSEGGLRCAPCLGLPRAVEFGGTCLAEHQLP
jgi:hypothetical protein